MQFDVAVNYQATAWDLHVLCSQKPRCTNRFKCGACRLQLEYLARDDAPLNVVLPTLGLEYVLPPAMQVRQAIQTRGLGTARGSPQTDLHWAALFLVSSFYVRG